MQPVLSKFYQAVEKLAGRLENLVADAAPGVVPPGVVPLRDAAPGVVPPGVVPPGVVPPGVVPPGVVPPGVVPLRDAAPGVVPPGVVPLRVQNLKTAVLDTAVLVRAVRIRLAFGTEKRKSAVFQEHALNKLFTVLWENLQEI